MSEITFEEPLTWWRLFAENGDLLRFDIPALARSYMLSASVPGRTFFVRLDTVVYQRRKDLFFAIQSKVPRC